MNRLIVLITICFFSSLIFAQPLIFQGLNDPTFNTGLDANYEGISTLALQNDGKIIVGGNCYMHFNGVERNGIARLNSDGSLDTSFNPGTGTHTINTGFPGVVNAIKIQPDGKIIIAGSFVMYNGLSINRVARLNPDGSLDQSFNTGAIVNDDIYTLTLQSDGKILIGGGLTGPVGNPNNSLMRLNPNGSLDASFNPGSGVNGYVYTSALQPDGKIIIGGTFMTYNGTARYGTARLNSDGSLDESYNTGTEVYGHIYTITLQSDGKIIIGGDISNNIGNPISVFRLNSDGSLDPTFQPVVSVNTVVYSSAIQSDGKIIVSGGFRTLYYDTPYPVNRLNADGTIDNTFSQDSVLQAYYVPEVVAAIVQPNGKIIIGGTFTSYGGVPKSNICRIMACSQTFGIDTIESCNPYTWIDGITYSSSNNTATHMLTNSNGCDSIVTLNLSVLGTASTIFDTVCDTYLWSLNGTVLTSSGTYTDTIPNANGCDSIITLNLIINNTTFGTETITECDEFTWPVNGQTYTTSGTYLDTLQNVNGCDSIITLNLTIHNTTFGSETIFSCDNYIWSNNGQTYTVSGTYIDTIPNANGCDSIITLNLTIYNTTFGVETVTECDEFIWALNGQTYTVTGTYLDTIINANGCDSIITLDLTIIPSLPLTVSTFSQPSDDNSCVGTLSISTEGNPDFMETIDGGLPITHSGYTLVENLCPGVHSLFTENGCGDTLTSTFIIPVDSNYIFNNPFIDSIAVDSLGATIEDCNIYYNDIDIAFIDSIFANGNTVTVIWNIVDSNGSNFDTSSYVLNNGNGVYYLQLSVFCPTKSLGEYFAVTEAIYFEDGDISTADLTTLDDDLFELFPNPTNEVVTIRFEAPKANLSVYDTHGKRITIQTILSGDSISLAHLESGVYFFELTTEQGKTVKRVVKQ